MLALDKGIFGYTVPIIPLLVPPQDDLDQSPLMLPSVPMKCLPICMFWVDFTMLTCLTCQLYQTIRLLILFVLVVSNFGQLASVVLRLQNTCPLYVSALLSSPGSVPTQTSDVRIMPKLILNCCMGA